jgi:tetratricopeptide (TPR) repeat protein
MKLVLGGTYILLLCGMLLVSCGPGADDHWQQYIAAGSTELSASRFGVAESLLTAAWDIAQTFPDDDSRRDVTLTKLAQATSSLGKYDEAIALYRLLLPRDEAKYGTESVEVARRLNTIGILCDWRARYDESKVCYHRAISILEDKLGPEHEEVYHLLRRLGAVYRLTGFFEEAEPFYLRAVEIREKLNRPYDESLLGDLALLAEVYILQEDLAAAEPLYRRILKTREEALGPDDPQVAAALENLAELLRNMGRNKEADRLTARAESIRGQL